MSMTGTIEHAIELYKGGLSIAQVAQHFGITRQGMWKALHKRSVEMRPGGAVKGPLSPLYRGGRTHYSSAHTKVNSAIKAGKLKRPSACENCGRDEKLAAHHDDYNKPLSVRWLCALCHFHWHKNNVAKGAVRKSGCKPAKRATK